MMPWQFSRLIVRTGAALALGASLIAAGCAPGEVELNGKIFDAMGVGSNQSTGSVAQLEKRQPLVVPPSLQRLPPPGAQPDVAAADGAFPIDPEKREAMAVASLEQQQAEYCKEHYEKALALGQRNEAAVAKGPLGLCSDSILKNLTGERAYER